MNNPQPGRATEVADRRPNGGFGVRLRADVLNERMQALGLTGAALARKAKVSEATISQARNGHRIHPVKFRAIGKALAELADLDPIPGVEALIDLDVDPRQ